MKKNMKKIRKLKEIKTKKPKEKEEYVFKKVRSMKVKRIIFWIILIYFFIRGIATTFRPDDTAEVTGMIKQFRTDFSNYKDQNELVMSFAQDFVKEYLTYKNRDEKDYMSRIDAYMPSAISSTEASNIMDLNGDAEVIYVQAYRKEEYSSNQYDVYVRADVKYSLQTAGNDDSVDTTSQQVDTTTQQKEVILKVPVYSNGHTCIVEDLPMFVNDDLRASDYTADSYSGKSVNDASVISSIKDSLTNFLKAYYEEDQSVIDYYLTKDADNSKFTGLGGRLLFEDIENIECYQEESGKILCIVKIKVKDSVNSVSMYQDFNLVVIRNNGMYYVCDMNTKTDNLNMGNN